MAGRYFLITLGAFLCLWRLFYVYPEIDLWVSGLFYQNGVWLGGVEPFAFLREVYYRGSIVLGIYIVIAALIATRRETELPKLFYGFFAVLVTVGVTAIVNGGFKEFYGRARPHKVEGFGGDRLFQSVPNPFFPYDQCDHNCSFISGEAAGAMTLILVGVALCGARRHLYKWVWLAILPMAFMRIMAGRHFLSDVNMSMVFISMFYWFMLWLIMKTPQDLWGSWGAFWRDFLGLFKRKSSTD